MIGRVYYLVVLVILILALLVGYLMKPGKKEHAFIKLKDKYYSDSLDEYYDLWKSGEKDENVVLPLATLFLQYGRVSDAIKIVEEYMMSNPNSIEGSKLLGKLYQYDQRPLDYLQNLEKLQKLDPQIEHLRELSRIYNSQENYNKQILITEEIIENYKSTKQDFFDLIFLCLADKQNNKIKDIIYALLKKNYKLSDEEIIVLINVALENQFAQESQIIFNRYVDYKNTPLMLQVASIFINYQQKDLALDIMKDLSLVVKKDPNHLAFYIDILLQLDRHYEAYELLKEIYHEKLLPPKLLNVFLGLLTKVKDYETIEDLLNNSDIGVFDENLLFDIIKKSLENDNYEIAKIIFSQTSNYFTKNDPVYLISLFGANKEKAQKLIKELDGKKISTESDNKRLKFGEILAKSTNPQVVFGVVKDIDLINLNRREILDLAKVFIKINYVDYALKYYQDFIKKNNLEQNDTMQSALFLLHGSKNNQEFVMSFLKSKYANLDILNEAYFIVSSKAFYELAIPIANAMYSLRQNDINMHLVADAYLGNKNYLQSLNYYKKLQQSNKDSVTLGYVKSLLGLKKDKKYEKELKKFMDNDFVSLSLDTKLEILSLYQDFDSHQNVKKHFAKIIPSLSNVDDKLNTVKAFLTADFIDLTEEIFNKMNKKDIDEDYIEKFLKDLAIANYYSSKYTKSKKYFDEYFKKSKGDYESYYIYAKLMDIDSNIKSAKKYYRKSLKILSKQTSLNYKEELVKARVLFELNQIQEAKKLYFKLLKQDPYNKELRIEFANYLIDIAQVELAQQIISKK